MQDPLFIPIATLLTAQRHIPFRQQVPVNVCYRGVIVDRHRLDLIVEGKVVVEIKAVREVQDIHLAVVLAYLKATRLVAGLILNFSEAKLRIRRVVRSTGLTAEAPKKRDAEGVSKPTDVALPPSLEGYTLG